jgi:23S rRNA (adenine1618-N6)-methyltransferase
VSNRSRRTSTTPSSGKVVPGAALFHPRNRHQGRYDFADLIRCCPQLRSFVRDNPSGQPSIDFSNATAVRWLNRALLQSQYGIVHWDFPSGYLCPPIPGRADYVHGLADLLAQDHAGLIPRGAQVRVLDIGTGASCVYPLIGHRDYGWRFVGSDIDPEALAAAATIIAANPGLKGAIELRRQSDPTHIFRGLLLPGERFDLSLCNPPFHASAAEAAAGSARKWHNLGRDPVPQRSPGARSTRDPGPPLNFGGHTHELWCPGGELAFARRMIDESVNVADCVLWFSTLISKATHLPALIRHLDSAGVAERTVGAMAQGQKQSRFLAWSFHSAEQRRNWPARGGTAAA